MIFRCQLCYFIKEYFGFVLDVNECETEVCGEHTCQNLSGSYRCVCNHGYQNHPDNQTICTGTCIWSNEI